MDGYVLFFGRPKATLRSLNVSIRRIAGDVPRSSRFRLADSDRQWVESVRTQHDPQASLIPVHFTVLFPAETDPAVVVGRAASVSEEFAQIRFSARQVLAVRDVDGSGGRVFLVPEVGSSDLVALYRRLNSEGHREDAFLPHMTMAADGDFEKCTALARGLEAMGRSIEGSIDSLDVVIVSANRARSLATLQLRGDA